MARRPATRIGRSRMRGCRASAGRARRGACGRRAAAPGTRLRPSPRDRVRREAEPARSAATSSARRRLLEEAAQLGLDAARAEELERRCSAGAARVEPEDPSRRHRRGDRYEAPWSSCSTSTGSCELLDAERDEERRRLDEARRTPLARRAGGARARPRRRGGRRGGRPRGPRARHVRARRRQAARRRSRLGVGSLVSRRAPPRARATTRRAGVVARRTPRRRVAVAFDEPPPDWATDGRVVLELEPSPVTWERLSAGIAPAARRRREGERWHAVLAGAAPRFARSSPAGRAPREPQRSTRSRPRALDLADRAEDLALVHGPARDRQDDGARRGRSAAPSPAASRCSPPRPRTSRWTTSSSGSPRRASPAFASATPRASCPPCSTHTLEARVAAHESARIARGLVEEAIALRREARKRKQQRGPGRFSASRGQERDARALFAEARALEDARRGRGARARAGGARDAHLARRRPRSPAAASRSRSSTRRRRRSSPPPTSRSSAPSARCSRAITCSSRRRSSPPRRRRAGSGSRSSSGSSRCTATP